MTVSVGRTRDILERENYTVYVDILPGDGGFAGRKIYISHSTPVLIPEPAHHHAGFDHVFILVRGKAQLATEQGARVEVVEMSPVFQYRVSGAVLHQLRLEPDSIVESLFDKQAWMNANIVVEHTLFPATGGDPA